MFSRQQLKRCESSKCHRGLCYSWAAEAKWETFRYNRNRYCNFPWILPLAVQSLPVCPGERLTLRCPHKGWLYVQNKSLLTRMMLTFAKRSIYESRHCALPCLNSAINEKAYGKYSELPGKVTPGKFEDLGYSLKG